MAKHQYDPIGSLFDKIPKPFAIVFLLCLIPGMAEYSGLISLTHLPRWLHLMVVAPMILVLVLGMLTVTGIVLSWFVSLVRKL